MSRYGKKTEVIFNLLLTVLLVLTFSSLAEAAQVLHLTLGKRPVFIEPAQGTPNLQSGEKMPFGLEAPFEIEKYDLSSPADRAQADIFMQEIGDIGVNVISHHFTRAYWGPNGQPNFTLHRKEIEYYVVDHGKYFWGVSRPRSAKCFLGDIDGETHQIISTQQDLYNAINNGHKCVPYSEEGLTEYENWLNQAFDIFDDYPDAIDKFLYFQISNEPDPWFEKSDKPDPTNPDDWYHQAYAQIAEKAYPIIKSRAPNTKVIIGATSIDSVAITGFYEPVLINLNNKCGETGCFDLFDYHSYGKFMTYNERPVIHPQQSIEILKSYAYFKDLLDRNGFSDKKLVIQQGGTYTGRGQGWAEILQKEKGAAIFLIKRMVYNVAKGMEQNQIISLMEIFCAAGDSIQSPFTLMGLQYNGSPVPGGTPSCSHDDSIPAQYDCDGQLPCPDPGFGVKKLSYWTYKLLIEKLRGCSWDDIQTVYEQDDVFVYKFNKGGQPIYVAWWDYWKEAGDTKNVVLTLDDMHGLQASITEAVPSAEQGGDLDPSDYPFFFTGYLVDSVLPCNANSDNDADVDGLDLAHLLHEGNVDDALNSLSGEFGRTDCP